MWMVEEKVCGWTKLQFIWGLNVAGAFLHFAWMIFAIVMGVKNGSGMDSPSVPFYALNLTWAPNTTDMLKPTLYKDGTELSLTWLAVFFFFCSFAAHTLVAATSWQPAVKSSQAAAQQITNFENFYYLWLADCRQPLRWIEYSFSATGMVVGIAMTTGLNQIYHVVLVAALMWSTMMFGLLSEALVRPQTPPSLDEKPTQWRTKSPLARLTPHLIGWVPYVAVWACIFHIFFNTAASASQAVPDFVYVAVVSQAIVFSLFGLTQLLLLLLDAGPSFYYWGEISYLVLSLVAKSLLGGVLIVNVLAFTSFDEAVANALA
jgi:hypothetical protein